MKFTKLLFSISIFIFDSQIQSMQTSLGSGLISKTAVFVAFLERKEISQATVKEMGALLKNPLFHAIGNNKAFNVYLIEEIKKKYCNWGRDNLIDYTDEEVALDIALSLNTLGSVCYLQEKIRTNQNFLDRASEALFYDAGIPNTEERLRMLISAGAPLNEMRWNFDTYCCTPLMRAVGNGILANTQLFLQAGANATILDDKQMNVLDHVKKADKANIRIWNWSEKRSTLISMLLPYMWFIMRPEQEVELNQAERFLLCVLRRR